MLLIDALVMVAQEYSEVQGWIIQNALHGRVVRLRDLTQPPVYLAYDERGTMIRGNSALEIVLSELVERDPVAATDAHWKISPYEPEYALWLARQEREAAEQAKAAIQGITNSK